MITHLAVVRHMGTGHQKIMRAHHRVLAHLAGAMHRHMLVKNIVIANAQPRRFPVIFQILRRIPDHCARVEDIIRADAREPRDIDLRTYPAVRAQLHPRINDGIGAHLDRRMHAGLRMDDGGGMNHERAAGPGGTSG